MARTLEAVLDDVDARQALVLQHELLVPGRHPVRVLHKAHEQWWGCAGVERGWRLRLWAGEAASQTAPVVLFNHRPAGCQGRVCSHHKRPPQGKALAPG